MTLYLKDSYYSGFVCSLFPLFPQPLLPSWEKGIKHCLAPLSRSLVRGWGPQTGVGLRLGFNNGLDVLQ
jgi:hypothetical protein